jgi:putative transcriptional regulator
MRKLGVSLLLLAMLMPVAAMSQERGTLLVATEQVTEEAFAETVILLLHYGADGAIGVAINRPTWVSTREVFPDFNYLRAYRGRVFHGGPLAQATVLVLSRRVGRNSDDEPLVDDVYMSPDPALLEAEFDASEDDDNVLRFYAGHASWRPDQLDEEIAAGAWRVVPGSAAAIFDAEPESLWRRLTAGDAQIAVYEQSKLFELSRGGELAVSR